MRIEEREMARALRRNGYSYGEIRKTVQVAKGTLNSWLKNIELTEQQKQRILQLEVDGRSCAFVKGPWRNREKSLTRIRSILAEAKGDFSDKIAQPLFVPGLVLYWAEGAKTERRFQFTNSDPAAIRLMVMWLTQCIGISKDKIIARVYVHRVYADCGFERYWEKVTDLPSSQFRAACFKPTPHRVRKNPSYMGCCRLEVNSSELFWRVSGWHEEFLNRVGVRLPEDLDLSVWTGNSRSVGTEVRP